MDKNDILIKFYNDLVTLSQEDILNSIEFFEQASMCMLLGHVLGNERIIEPKAYEALLLWNLSYIVYKKNAKENKTEDLIKIFKNVDKEYYENLMNGCQDILFSRELYCVARLAFEIEKDDGTNIYIKMLDTKNPELHEAYNSFSNLKNIIRVGFIKRNVDANYCESDSTHIMQMVALASAYLRLYKPEDLKYQKVIEMILIHEIGENLAGDIAEGDKRHQSKHDLEAIAVENTFKKLVNGQYFVDLWNEFEERKTKEAVFVYQLDKLDPILKAKYLDEVLNRNDLFAEFYNYEAKRDTFVSGALEGLFLKLNKKE